MKTLEIDIETYSSADLSKCGVYKYVEAPDFGIILFGYSIDGGEVCVVNLAQGETLPTEVLSALEDESVIKYAFNASFERVCISRFLGYTTGEYLDPSSWRCSMIWSAYLGLPLSLKGVGTVLGLDKQKMDEGKDLIKFFCQPCAPTKANGGRTRNLPSDAPDKWATFKDYNKRDVEVEMLIQRKLAKFPVPDSVWDEYHLSEEINDRGIRVDMPFVKQAIAFDERSRTRLFAAMRDITELDNPNSVQQMKSWLADNGLETDTLGKKAVAALVKDAPGELGEVLQLRQQLAKSSVKKYTAMENAVCADDRVRGMFMFYGANRTGRWCLTGDHEVLTDNGWMRLDEWDGGRIACWNPHGETVSFQKAKQLAFPYQGVMFEYTDKRISQISTPDHRMYVKKRYGGEWITDTVQNMASYRPSIPFTGFRQTTSGLEHGKLRVMVMVQADGHYCEDGTIKLGFTKIRKAERCKSLLRAADIQYSYKEYTDSAKTRLAFTILSRDVPLWLRQFKDKTFGSWLFDESADVFFDELVYWDGYRSAKNSIQYVTCNKQNADTVQAFAHISGRAASIRTKTRADEHPNWSDAYYVDIWLTPINCHEVRVKPKLHNFDGQVYCAETSTGYFLVRRDGKVWVTGNSGRLVQLQNLPQNHIPDLAEARSLVAGDHYDALEMLYEDIPDTLSQLIRTAFVPRVGEKFIVSDFSAIEARVIAWLAGESWRTEVFQNGGDIYCASASAMFKVPVEKHGVNGHLRQKGKIAELALGYGGSVGALKAMGALEMGLTEDELQPLVDAWRKSNQRIVKFWWDVDRAVKTAVKEKTTASTNGVSFSYQSGFLFITLPSGRRLAYVKPRIGENRFGGESVTYEGIGSTKKWERLESYGPKFVENIVQATSRDILMYAMQTLRCCSIVAHVHDELIIECGKQVSVDAICEQMGRVPPWAKGLILRADGYECDFYKKD